MKNKTYIPSPIDTGSVSLPPELLELQEMISRNVHETWAAGRIADGWKYGPVRNDATREHPCLIPYEELPESEKEYDRKTAYQTLKTIVKLGFKIERESGVGGAAEDGQES